MEVFRNAEMSYHVGYFWCGLVVHDGSIARFGILIIVTCGVIPGEVDRTFGL